MPERHSRAQGIRVYVVTPASSGLVTLKLTHRGDSNFAVIAYSSGGADLLANEIGRYSGETLLPDGTFLIAFSAEGSWSATPG